MNLPPRISRFALASLLALAPAGTPARALSAGTVRQRPAVSVEAKQTPKSKRNAKARERRERDAGGGRASRRRRNGAPGGRPLREHPSARGHRRHALASRRASGARPAAPRVGSGDGPRRGRAGGGLGDFRRPARGRAQHDQNRAPLRHSRRRSNTTLGWPKFSCASSSANSPPRQPQRRKAHAKRPFHQATVASAS